VGRATSILLASHGFDVALLARGRAGLEAAGAEVERGGARALLVPVDVADEEAVGNAATRIEDELGPIDVWVNNAMTTTFSPVSDTAADDLETPTNARLGLSSGLLGEARSASAYWGRCPRDLRDAQRICGVARARHAVLSAPG
jgi:NAD(P)-dependent dehydrogenase (short-subunit alcohol dehydrogenase family)